ncbi:olfactory receptor 1013-like [Hyla sarda]|uniref:olfactory receptor 1013-like n=1 Tax=Hyla sarda TaxID=327740 RepID=UPI0024C31944|nr:olfactory receptor 1013-like [Hyla sarda]
MDQQNNTVEFFIVGFSDVPNVRFPLFLFFLLVYIMTIVGNLILIVLISSSSLFSTPMYFFLCNLSTLDIVYTSVTSPKLIHIFATNNGKISFLECMVQLFFFDAFWNTEYFLLTVMAYDRYVAICKPLHYMMIMNRRLCIIAAAGTWIGGMLGSITPTVPTAMATYRTFNILNHFFCDIKALETVAIGNASYIRNAILVHGLLCVTTSLVLILVSYFYIITTIFMIRSRKGKYKAFSTCASHLSMVSMFYILLFDLYFRPKSTVSPHEGKVLTVLYVYIIPLLNPAVYSFRNREVKEACRKMIKKNVVRK